MAEPCSSPWRMRLRVEKYTPRPTAYARLPIPMAARLLSVQRIFKGVSRAGDQVLQ